MSSRPEKLVPYELRPDQLPLRKKRGDTPAMLAPGFHPQLPNQAEDSLETKFLQHGFERACPVPKEQESSLASVQRTASYALAKALAEGLNSITQKKEVSNGLIDERTDDISVRPGPAVMKNLPAWFKALAADRPLQPLASRLFPYFSNRDQVFKFLIDEKVPLSRACWFFKLAVKVDVERNVTLINSQVGWAEAVQKKLKMLYDRAIGQSHSQTTVSDFIFLARLASSLFQEGVLDRQTWLDFLCMQLKRETSAIVFMPLVIEHIKGFVTQRALSSLLYSRCLHLYKDASSERLKASVQNVMHYLLINCPDAIMDIDRFPVYQESESALQAVFSKDLEYRKRKRHQTEAVMAPVRVLPVASHWESTVSKIHSALCLFPKQINKSAYVNEKSSYDESFSIQLLYEHSFANVGKASEGRDPVAGVQTDPDTPCVVRLICEWACAPYGIDCDSFRRPILAASLLHHHCQRTVKKYGNDVTRVKANVRRAIDRFIDSAGQQEVPIVTKSLARLLAELHGVELFSYEQFVRTLITTYAPDKSGEGLLQTARDSGDNVVMARVQLFAELPVLGPSSHWANMRRITLYGSSNEAMIALMQEDLQPARRVAEQVVKLLERQPTNPGVQRFAPEQSLQLCLATPDFGMEWEDSPEDSDAMDVSENISFDHMALFHVHEISQWVVQSVKQYVHVLQDSTGQSYQLSALSGEQLKAVFEVLGKAGDSRSSIDLILWLFDNEFDVKSLLRPLVLQIELNVSSIMTNDKWINAILVGFESIIDSTGPVTTSNDASAWQFLDGLYGACQAAMRKCEQRIVKTLQKNSKSDRATYKGSKSDSPGRSGTPANYDRIYALEDMTKAEMVKLASDVKTFLKQTIDFVVRGDITSFPCAQMDQKQWAERLAQRVAVVIFQNAATTMPHFKQELSSRLSKLGFSSLASQQDNSAQRLGSFLAEIIRLACIPFPEVVELARVCLENCLKKTSLSKFEVSARGSCYALLEVLGRPRENPLANGRLLLHLTASTKLCCELALARSVVPELESDHLLSELLSTLILPCCYNLDELLKEAAPKLKDNAALAQHLRAACCALLGLPGLASDAVEDVLNQMFSSLDQQDPYIVAAILQFLIIEKKHDREARKAMIQTIARHAGCSLLSGSPSVVHHLPTFLSGSQPLCDQMVSYLVDGLNEEEWWRYTPSETLAKMFSCDVPASGPSNSSLLRVVSRCLQGQEKPILLTNAILAQLQRYQSWKADTPEATPVEEQQLALRLTLLLVLASYIGRSRDTAATMGALVEVLLQICKHFTSRDDFESPSSVQSLALQVISSLFEEQVKPSSAETKAAAAVVREMPHRLRQRCQAVLTQWLQHSSDLIIHKAATMSCDEGPAGSCGDPCTGRCCVAKKPRQVQQGAPAVLPAYTCVEGMEKAKFAPIEWAWLGARRVEWGESSFASQLNTGEVRNGDMAFD